MSHTVNFTDRLKLLKQLPLGHLAVVGPVFRRGAHRYVYAHCSACGAKRPYLVSNLLSGGTTDCRCQRSIKYGKNPLAKVLGQRYDAIRQRLPDKIGFPNREAFVRYMLELADVAQPKINSVRQLRNFRIQRLSQRRGFEKGNLRLVRAP